MPKYSGIRKIGSRWYYRYQRGKHRFVSKGYPTAEEAFAGRLDFMKRARADDTIQSSITVAEFCAKYLDEYSRHNVRHLTALKEEGLCRNHIIPILGTRRLQDLKPYHLAQFQNTIVKTKSPAVAFNVMRTFRTILNKAVEWEFIERNPIKGKLPTEPHNEHPVLTMDILFRVVDELQGRDRCVVALAGFAGLRRGEIFGLKWEDLDFKASTLNVRRQFSGGAISPTKTKESASLIPIWPRLTRMLAEWKLASGSPEWVFMGRGGKPYWGEGWCSHEWQIIKKRFALPARLRFHDLRHTYASILLSEGTAAGDVQKLLRHSSIRMTMDTYRHILPGQLERTFEVFNRGSGQEYGQNEKSIQQI
jgi:integrase